MPVNRKMWNRYWNQKEKRDARLLYCMYSNKIWPLLFSRRQQRCHRKRST